MVGHDAVAYIAERHLLPEVKDSISRYLDGKSIVYYASWTDRVRAMPEYKHSNSWHVVLNTPDMKYTKRASGDAVYGLTQELEKLFDRQEHSDSAIAVAIKFVVHLVGDMHCPGHSKYEDHSQSFEFNLFGKPLEYHKFWDTVVLTRFRSWNYTEFAHQLDCLSDEDEVRIAAGSVLEWAEENARECRIATQLLTPGCDIDGGDGWKVMMQCEELAHRQIQKAGIRLAALLNKAFGG